MHYLYGILVLYFLIATHELGHYVACLRAGVPVDHMRIGFGPSLRFRVRGLDVRVGCIPLVGWVSPCACWTTPVPVSVALAGPAVSYLTAVACWAVMLSGVALTPGRYVLNVIVGPLWFGLRVLGSVWHDVVHPTADHGFVEFTAALGHETRRGWRDAVAVVGTLAAMLTGLNLVPIPPLDGGKAIEGLYYRVRGRALPLKVWAPFVLLGLGLNLWLFGWTVAADVLRLVRYVRGA